MEAPPDFSLGIRLEHQIAQKRYQIQANFFKKKLKRAIIRSQFITKIHSTIFALKYLHVLKLLKFLEFLLLNQRIYGSLRFLSIF